jgi:hypothetical protein
MVQGFSARCTSETPQTPTYMMKLINCHVKKIKKYFSKQERNSNQVRALLEQSNIGTDGPTDGTTNQPTDEVSYRGAMLAPRNNAVFLIEVIQKTVYIVSDEPQEHIFHTRIENTHMKCFDSFA